MIHHTIPKQQRGHKYNTRRGEVPVPGRLSAVSAALLSSLAWKFREKKECRLPRASSTTTVARCCSPRSPRRASARCCRLPQLLRRAPARGRKEGPRCDGERVSWRDLILVYPWNNVNGLPQVALFEVGCTVKALRPESSVLARELLQSC